MEIKAILKKMSREQKIRLCTGQNNWQTANLDALDIPSLTMSDGTNGVRFQKGSTSAEDTSNLYDTMINFSFDTQLALDNTYPATCFPTGSALACSWDTALAQDIGKAVAAECKNLGIGLLLGPGMNIRRHPLTARNFEYYSEDPVLSGDMAAGMVCGIQQEGVGATLKHYICNNSDTRRTILNCVVEERALREIYLAGFERAVKKAKPAAVMGSYPAVNGVQACESKWLLSDVLRDEWGFEGVTVCDWGAVKDSALAVKSGLDLQMPRSRQYIDQVTAALATGGITEQELDVHCERILQLVFQYSRAGKEARSVDWEQQHALAQRAAAECGVLLRNENNRLPLDAATAQTVAVLGGIAKAPVYQGSGCAIVNAKRVDIPLEELKQNAPGVSWLYAEGYRSDFTTTDALLDEAVAAAKAADVAVVMLGSRLPEESDEYDRTDLHLADGQLALLKAVCAVRPDTIVVLFNGDVLAMPWAEETGAILDMWYAGEGCGKAVADLLFGVKNPSGKLAVTVPRSIRDTPSYLDFPHEQDTDIYREGIFVGYRYYDKRGVEPLYPFGFGLSYTCFSYDAIMTETHGDEVLVTLRVTNTGPRPGHEIVQLYIAPACATVFRPEKELKGFAKLFLEPGESQTVTLRLGRRDFAWYNDKSGCWQVDGGTYRILCGGGSRDIRLEARVELTGDVLPIAPLKKDSHYTELFASPAVSKVYFDFLVEKGLLRPEQVGPELEEALKKTFWGFSQHLDMQAGTTLSTEDLAELLVRMNRAV